jgi:hypothetical protein
MVSTKNEKTVEVHLSAIITVKVQIMGDYVSDAAVTDLAEEIVAAKVKNDQITWGVQSRIVGQC